MQLSEAEVSAYKTISFGSNVPGTDSALLAHDPALVLCLGLLHAFDKKSGYGWTERER